MTSLGFPARASAGALVQLCLVGITACAQQDSPPSVAAPRPLDNAAIGALAARYKTFPRENTRSFPSAQHQGHPLSDIFVDDEARPTYRTISQADDAAEGFRFPVGSMIVKEMRPDDGGALVLTVMYKQPAGFDPARHDWWFGRLFADGTPTDPAVVGRVAFCGTCHDGTAQWDYAWGLPAGNKVTP